MPIHDLGYRGWQGKLTNEYLRWSVIAEHGIRLVWKSMWLRRMLFFAWMPAAAAGFAFFLYEQTVKRPPDLLTTPLGDMVRWMPQSEGVVEQWALDPASARHDVWAWILQLFFRYPQNVLMVVVVGLIAPSLIAQDVRSRAFLLYFARPLSAWEYVLGKASVVWCYLALITTVPALALYLIGVLLSPDLSVVTYTWDLPLRILAASFLLMVPTTALALMFSSMTSESRYAGFAWFAMWIMGRVAYVMLSISGTPGKWTALSLYDTLSIVQTWVFGLSYDENLNQVTASLTLLTLVTAAAVVVLMQRVSAPMRI